MNANTNNLEEPSEITARLIRVNQKHILDQQERIQRQKDLRAGIVPGNPFSEYGFVPMSPAFFTEVEKRADLKFIFPSDAKILREAQAKWDACEKILAQYSMTAVNARWQKMLQDMPSKSLEDLNKMSIPTLHDMKLQAVEHRKALRPKFQQITQEAFPTVCAIMQRVKKAAEKVFKEVEAEEKSFAMRLGFEHKPSQFQIALGQFSWRHCDYLGNPNGIATELIGAPKDFLHFLPEINDYFK